MVAKGYEQLAEGAYYDQPAGLLVFDLFRATPSGRTTG
jgi:hypothetical protein